MNLEQIIGWCRTCHKDTKWDWLSDAFETFKCTECGACASADWITGAETERRKEIEQERKRLEQLSLEWQLCVIQNKLKKLEGS